VVGAITPDQLDDATPCRAFTVRGVLEHMIAGATTFAAAYRGLHPPEPNFDDPIVGVKSALGVLASSIAAAGALDRTIEAPFGATDGESVARFVVQDGLVHRWDLSVATGQEYRPPDGLVADATAFAEQAVDTLRDGDTFKPAVEPDARATPIERLAAYTGRTPS
jgi:uncharacterized protein (TIGR03086 family)